MDSTKPPGSPHPPHKPLPLASTRRVLHASPTCGLVHNAEGPIHHPANAAHLAINAFTSLGEGEALQQRMQGIAGAAAGLQERRELVTRFELDYASCRELSPVLRMGARIFAC